MAEKAGTSATETPEEITPETPAAEKPAAKAEAAEPEVAPAPVPDPETCRAIAIGLDTFYDSVDADEWRDTEFEYYLEPAGVLNGPLVCTRAPENNPQRAGLLMTRAAWQTKTLFLEDGVNPETYELSFPKEFGYVKPVAHYKDETRKSEKYPWSKKY